MSYATTPSQTVGPYFAIGLPWPAGPFAVAPDSPGAIKLAGVVYDGAGEPISDSLLEIWGADGNGNFADEPAANAADPILARVPAERRDTLIATPTADGYAFDIRVQGPGETVFFAV